MNNKSSGWRNREIKMMRRVLVGILLMFFVVGSISISDAITKTDFFLKMPNELPNGFKLIDIHYLDSPHYTNYKFGLEHFPHFINCKSYIYSAKQVSEMPAESTNIIIYEFESEEYAIADFQKLIVREPENAMLLSDFILESRIAGEKAGMSAELIEAELADLVQLERDIPNYCIYDYVGDCDGLFQLDKYIVMGAGNEVYSLNKVTQTPTPQPVVTPPVTPTPSPSPTPVLTPTLSPSPTSSPTPDVLGFETAFAIAGVLIMAYILRRRE